MDDDILQLEAKVQLLEHNLEELVERVLTLSENVSEILNYLTNKEDANEDN
jgi:hypothetical protein